jgi:alcohol dehydrogenase class IV
MDIDTFSKQFNFFVPTQIRFGAGKLEELKDITPSMGSSCLIVSRPRQGSLQSTYTRMEHHLDSVGIQYSYFDEVVPNPTQEGVEKGIRYALDCKADFVIGVGGGSVMDTAKLISFLRTPSGQIDWEDALKKYDNPFARSASPPSSIPFIAVSTTSGTGSHCTQAAVVSDPVQQDKITLFHSGLFPSIAIVDPELMVSVPASVTAATGFDAFTHAFESFLGGRTSPLTERMSLEAIKLVIENVPLAMEDPKNIELRSRLAWADTLAGMCLANGGADLPHPLGEIIGGICSRVPHGETLAMVYPAFLKYKEQIAARKFIQVASHLGLEPQAKALTSRLLDFLSVTKLNESFDKAAMNATEIKQIQSHPLLDRLIPDNKTLMHQLMHDSLK